MIVIEPKYQEPTKPLSLQQVCRHRALLAFTLRSWGLKHDDIKNVLRLRSKEHARAMVAKGHRLFVDCVAGTVPP